MLTLKFVREISNKFCFMGQLTTRQQMISNEVTDPRMRNWLCANMAIRETSKELAKGVHRLIAHIHKRMLSSIGPVPLCKVNCSRTDQPWCYTCERWRVEILALCDHNYETRINWTRLNSSQWPINPYEVGRAFIPRAHRLYYKSAEFHEDIRFSLSFLENCLEVELPRALCQRAWQSRGKILRKHGLMRMCSQELEDHIEVLVELLVTSGLTDTYDVVEKLQTLQADMEEKSDGCVLM